MLKVALIYVSLLVVGGPETPIEADSTLNIPQTSELVEVAVASECTWDQVLSIVSACTLFCKTNYYCFTTCNAAGMAACTAEDSRCLDTRVTEDDPLCGIPHWIP